MRGQRFSHSLNAETKAHSLSDPVTDPFYQGQVKNLMLFCIGVLVFIYLFLYPIFRAKKYIYVTRSKDRGGYVWGYLSAFRY